MQDAERNYQMLIKEALYFDLDDYPVGILEKYPIQDSIKPEETKYLMQRNSVMYPDEIIFYYGNLQPPTDGKV